MSPSPEPWLGRIAKVLRAGNEPVTREELPQALDRPAPPPRRAGAAAVEGPTVCLEDPHWRA